jgi:TldD protein
LESLLHRGSAAGADLVEVFLERTDYIGLLAEQDRITSVNPSFAPGQVFGCSVQGVMAL